MVIRNKRYTGKHVSANHEAYQQKGSSVEYFQLAHTERHPETGNPVAKIIHSFSRADQLDRDQLVRLCRSIARVCGVEVRDSTADQATIAEETGLFDELSIKTTSSLGCPLVIENLWERLGIKKSLENVAAGREKDLPYERALLAMVANKLCEPESKLVVGNAGYQRPGCLPVRA